MAVPKRVADRLSTSLKRLRDVMAQQRARDVSEADTVTLIKDVLSDAFGYDKYAELTSEHAIRGTYCDIALSVDGKVWALIEAKAIGTTLDDRHVKQAIDYASNKGVEWCLLTNGAEWRLYNVIFAKPIDKRLIAQVDLLTVDMRNDSHLERLYLFTKEGFSKGAHAEARDRQNATSRHLVAALLLHNDDVLGAIRRELRKLADIKIDEDEIVPVLEHQVIKRDCLEGPEAEQAASRVSRRRGKTGAKRTDSPQTEVACTGANSQPETATTK